MKPRPYTPISLVAMPHGLNARSLLALGTSLETEAKPHKSSLPKLVSAALKNIVEKREFLQGEIALPAQQNDEPSAKQTDVHVDRSFSVCEHMLGELARLPDTYPCAAKARNLRSRLFPQGLDFVHWNFQREWGQTNAILKTIDDDGLEKDLVLLVGADVVRYMREAHTAYGKALGLTAQKTPTTAPALREHMDALMEAIRVYVVRVAGNEDPTDQASVERTAQLLRPLTEWYSAPKQAKEVPATPAAAATPAP